MLQPKNNIYVASKFPSTYRILQYQEHKGRTVAGLSQPRVALGEPLQRLPCHSTAANHYRTDF